MTDDTDEALQGLARDLFGHGKKPEGEAPPPPTEGNVAPREGTVHHTSRRDSDEQRLVRELFGAANPFD